MRALRWKSKYLTGIPEIDERNRSLVNILNERILDSSKVEHCQDLNDLHDSLAKLLETMLSQANSSIDKYEDEIQQFISRELPLPALDGSACHSCELCDIFETRIKAWLDAAR